MCTGRDIALLQDTDAANVTAVWGVAYRDVYILNQQNAVVEAYNLTDNDLEVTGNFDYLLGRLVELAGQ